VNIIFLRYRAFYGIYDALNAEEAVNSVRNPDIKTDERSIRLPHF
jgi:hypothetical protein